MNKLACRACGTPLTHSFLDLGSTPLANAFLKPAERDRPEPRYPLHVRVCSSCLLVQLPQVESPERIFSDYVYFSSYSESWLRHARALAEQSIARHRLSRDSLVLEVGSNDGYLLQYFAAAGIPVLGVEPASNVAKVAAARGLRTMNRFFGAGTARDIVETHGRADLVIGNNVLAHVPDLNDFVAGLAAVLKENGVLSVEFPHLLNLMLENQFDTIYHEHFCYFSLHAIEQVFRRHELGVFEVESLPVHGGSLRIRAAHARTGRETGASVQRLREQEQAHGLDRLESYSGFADRPRRVRESLLRMLQDARRGGDAVVAYGAAAKGNTLLNFCGIGADLVDYAVDLNPHKQGLLLPGSRIPVHDPQMLARTRPAWILVLPWNLREEIVGQLSYAKEWGAKFIVPIPEPRVLP